MCTVTVLPDQHHLLLLCQRDDGRPVRVFEHKSIDHLPIREFAFIDADIFVEVV